MKKGYQLTDGFVWPKKKVQQELLIGANHHLSLYNKELECVEIHWKLIPNISVSGKIINAIIADNSQDITFSGRKFTVLSKEFELLYLLLHGAKHGWSRLKWLVDIKDYPVMEIDDDKFNLLAHELQAGRIIGQSNFLLEKFFGTHMPFGEEERLPGYLVRFALQCIHGDIKEENSIQEIIQFYRYNFFLFPGFRYKCRMIGNCFLRPSDFSIIDSSFKAAYYLYYPYSVIKRRFLHV